MFTEATRSLIGYAILLVMAGAAVAALLYKNRSRIREIFTDENGKWDLMGGLERYLSKDSKGSALEEAPEDASPDEDFMTMLMRRRGARMRDLDPESGKVREHIIFRGRVQGVGFRYQAMYAARDFGLTGWVANLPDGTVEMEVQGTPVAMGKMMKHLRSGHWIRIDDMDLESMQVVPGEKGFNVKGY